MQNGLGAPHEPGLVALDRVVAEAARRNLRLILPFADYWPAYGGIAQWLAWRGTPVADEDRAHPERYAARFYGDPQLREAYATRVRQLATRINTVASRGSRVWYVAIDGYFVSELSNRRSTARTSNIATSSRTKMRAAPRYPRATSSPTRRR